MIGLGIGRQDNDAARYAVKFDQRERCRELARRRQENRPARQVREPAAKARSALKVGEA